MRSIQEIFNAVIESGYYTEEKVQTFYSASMCLSLIFAKDREVITPEEKTRAQKEIDVYMQTSPSLFLVDNLKSSNLPYDFSSRLAIYLDWGNRPELRI